MESAPLDRAPGGLADARPGEAVADVEASAGEAPAPPSPAALAAVAAALREDPHAFSFFQAVRLLEHLHPDRARVGGFADPGHEVARFSVPPSLSFPASEIQALDLPEDQDEPARLDLNFMGLVGPQGVLPYHYTLLVAERIRSRDGALRAFLDIFQHRIVSLFYRAWRKSRPAVTYGSPDEDRVTDHLLDLIGLGVQGYRDRSSSVPDQASVFHAGLLAPQQRGALALEQLLEDHFGVPVEVEQFVGGWYPLSRGDLCAVGGDDTPSARLGRGAVAGDEVWDQQARVRVRLGPLDRERFEAFLPGGSAHEPLRSLLRHFSHDQFDFEAQLVLERDEVPGCVLGEPGDRPQRLGWTTWIRSAPFARDADETTLSL